MHREPGEESASRIVRRVQGAARHFYLFLLFAFALNSLAQQNRLPYQDVDLPVEARVHDLIDRMTLEEKASQMINHAAAIPRLGIPAYDWWNEGLHGVARAGAATVFPQAIGLAATWDTDLIHSDAEIISTEARIKNRQALAADEHGLYRGLTFWSPNINLFRDPRWGRGQETYGEDPFLTGSMGSSFIRGLQGSDAKYLKLVATPKHFAVHSGPEPTRHTADIPVSAHDLEDSYLPAFREAVTAAQAQSVMCAYNAVRGEPACGSDLLLQKTLRSDWKFRGYVVSDCGAVSDFVSGHKTVADEAAASAAAVRAGTDLDCGREYLHLPEAVHRGLIQESEMDAALMRLFTARFWLGLFDGPQATPWSNLPDAENDSAANRQAALRTAIESLVLLKNRQSLLPLHNLGRIALIGPNADQHDVLEGNYSGTPTHPVTLLDGMRERFGKNAILFAQGSLLAEGIPTTMPESAFAAHGGLQAEFFGNTNFRGDPVLRRAEASVDAHWRQIAPVEGLAKAGYSVRWSGVWVPEFDGSVPLGIRRGNCWDCTTDDAVQMFVDGKPWVADQGGNRDGQLTVRSLEVRKGRPVSLRFEYVNTSGEGEVQLVWAPPAAQMIDQVLAAARKADVVVLALGISPALEGEEMPVAIPGFRGGDRTSLALPEAQQKLFAALRRTGKPLCVVLMNGSALSIPEVDEQADAILEAWYPGEEGGRAIAQTLAGDASPGGRLPVTFYHDVGQLPPFEDYSMAGRTYRYFAGEPLYRFGYGLSYSTFGYSDLQIDPGMDPSKPFAVHVRVRNLGDRAADEVVQAYLSAPPRPGAPLRSLAAFARVPLQAGESRLVSLTINPRSLSVVDEEGKRSIPAGAFSLWVGGGQPGNKTPGVAGTILVHEAVPGLPR